MSSEVTCNVTNYLTLFNKAKYYYEKGHSNNTEAYERICPDDGEPVQLLILIATAPVNYAKRMAIRQTWGGYYGLRRDVAVGFMLGRTENPFIERSLRNENHLYGDMIRGNFVDRPRNVTLKTVSMLEWTLKFCSKVNYLLKANDDAFINVGKLLEFVGSLLHEERSIYGQLNVCSKPVRSGKTKNQVSWRDFSGLFYPPFLSGTAYLLSSDVIPELYYQSLNTSFFRLEDVFLTGMVAETLGIRRVDTKEFGNVWMPWVSPCKLRKTIALEGKGQHLQLWEKLLRPGVWCQ
ncbi:hypothetical protein quinque_003326 [Culex quinquefasciatus]